MIEKHILLGLAGSIEAADERLRPLLSAEAIAGAVEMVPDDWLEEPEKAKAGYLDYLEARLNGPRPWLEEAENARHRA